MTRFNTRIGQLYAIESQAKEASPEQRLQLRQTHSREILTQIETLLLRKHSLNTALILVYSLISDDLSCQGSSASKSSAVFAKGSYGKHGNPITIRINAIGFAGFDQRIKIGTSPPPTVSLSRVNQGVKLPLVAHGTVRDSLLSYGS